MLWLVPAWVLSLVAAYLLGFFLRGITKKLAELDEKLQNEIAPPKQEEPSSTIIDPLDAVQTALYEQKKLMEKLNGK